MAELADAPDLGSGGAILVGSSPSPGIAAAFVLNGRAAEGHQGGELPEASPLLDCRDGSYPESPSDGGLAIFVAQQAIIAASLKATICHIRVSRIFTRPAQGEKCAFFIAGSRLWERWLFGRGASWHEGERLHRGGLI